MMSDFACKIASSDNFFNGSERSGASSDTVIKIISPLAEGDPSRSGMGRGYRGLNFVGRNSNREVPRVHAEYGENSSAAIPMFNPRKDCCESVTAVECQERTGDKARNVPPQQIGHDLANLLEAEIVYGIPGFDGTAAQSELPV
jgi:hypothetical protein